MSKGFSARGRWRHLRLGLPTLLGWRRQGFFIPHRYAWRLPGPSAYPAIQPLFTAAIPRFRALLAAIERYGKALTAIADGPPPAPRWSQQWFPRLDAAVAYTLLREERPRRVIEIGSGHSTRFFARAAADAGLEVLLTAIDPAPRASLEALPLHLERKTLQECGAEPFQGLAAGDFVFLDSSHILMPGSDLDFFFGQILPGLPRGSFLHFHDIFLPDPYPASWGWRGYNEQQALLPLLLGGGWEILWSSHFLTAHRPALLASPLLRELPLPPEALESSLWLRRL